MAVVVLLLEQRVAALAGAIRVAGVIEVVLRAFLKGLKQTVRAPAAAIGLVLERADGASKNLELDRLKMVIRDNIVTPEVKADGYGGVDAARFAVAIDQLAYAYKFKAGKPKPDDIFDASFLPPAAERQAN